MTNTHRAVVLFFITFLLIANFPTNTNASNAKALKKDDPRVVKIVGKLKRAISNSNFSALKPYVDVEKKIKWDIYGSAEDPLRYSYDEITAMLLKKIRPSSITVVNEADVYLWNSKENSYMVHIHTEGWADEYPYMTFLFKFMQEEQEWKWYGVYYDKVPPSVFKKALGW
jgi:hypothetical protein